MRTSWLAVSLLLCGTALAQSDPEWNSIIVRFTIASDGLHVTEQVQVDVPPAVQRLERTYWTDAEQQARFDSITLYDGERTVPLAHSADLDRAHHFHESEWPGKVEWSVRDKADKPAQVRSLTYVIEFRVSDAVIPAWSIPRGRLTHANFGEIGDPRERLRSILPLWREALRNPRHRYLIDYQFEMPPPSTRGTEIQLQIYWPPGWNPVHEITSGTIARPLDRDPYDPDRWRVTHLFEEDGRAPLTGIDVRSHAIRIGALAGFPLIALLFWIAFVVRELVRRPRAGADEQTAREIVFREPPELIEARWAGFAPYAGIEPFLRRMEKENKLAISIENSDAEDPHVSLRLLVPRERLTAYERAGIEALIPEGWETTSEEVRRRHAGEEFNPPDVLDAHLSAIAAASKQKKHAPWFSRSTSLLLFGAGAVLAFQEPARFHREPAVLFGALMVSSMLVSAWPNMLVRSGVRSSLAWSAILLIPLLLLTTVVVLAHFIAQLPPTWYGSLGLALMALAAYKAILAASATHDTPEVAQLARARRWLRAELRKPSPSLRDEDIPWLNALELSSEIERWRRRHQTPESRFATSRWTGNPPPDADEEWGNAFMT